MLPLKTSQPSDFIVDPARDGIANALWFANSGTLALSGASPEQFRFNTDDAIIRADVKYGVFEFAVTFPTTGVQTPTDLTDDVAFGLKNISMGDYGKIDVFVDQSGDSITFRTYNNEGTIQSTTLTWDTDWNNALTIFRFGWGDNHVSLDVLVNAATTWTNLANHETSFPTRPLNMFVNVVGADNFDVDFIAARNVQNSSIMLI